MRECRQLPPDVGEALGLCVAYHEALAFRTHVDDHPPRIDQHRVSPRAPAARVRAGLGGGEHVALVLDRPRTKQRLPVSLSGARGERSRYDEQRDVAERAIELREA